MIVVVTGYPRCGSSLMMRMLDTAGYPVQCDLESHGHGYEATRIDWIDGTAVKLLHPVKNPPPQGGDYLFLHLTRDARNQAKSGIKFLRSQDWNNFYDLEHAERMIENYTAEARRLLPQIGETIEVTFENLIKGRVDKVAERLGLDADLMRSVIVARGPATLAYMLEAYA